MERLSNISEKDIQVKNSGLVTLQKIGDDPDGILLVGENGRNIPFEVPRFYFIFDLFRREAQRGCHTHWETSQVIFCMQGSFDLNLDDSKTKQTLIMDTRERGIILGPMLWHEMCNFSPDCIIFVVANAEYNKEDYIRSYEEFIEAVQKKH